MKPKVLKAHLKPITRVVFNKEGDLLFVSSKDKTVTIWYTKDGSLLGSITHKGSINCVDVNFDSTRFVTSSATGDISIYNVKDGILLSVLNINQTPVKSAFFSEGGKEIICVTEKAFDNPSSVFILDVPSNLGPKDPIKIKHVIIYKDCKALYAIWGPVNENFLVGCDDGSVKVYKTENFELIKTIHDHKNTISKLTASYDKTLFLSCSTDNTARLYDFEKYECLKVYNSSEPINTAVISPTNHHVILGGGTSAVNVTTTVAKNAYFETRFFHSVYEEELGTVKGHFGPIHSLAFSPDGKSYVSGGEDGYVKLFLFDEEYKKLAN